MDEPGPITSTHPTESMLKVVKNPRGQKIIVLKGEV